MSVIYHLRFLFLFSMLFSQTSYSAAIVFSSVSTFGKVLVGSTKTLDLTVVNNSSKQVRLDSYWYNNNNPYKVSGGTCQFNQTTGFILGALKNCTLSVSFSPKVVSQQSSIFTMGYFLDTSWTWQESNLTLSGEGVAMAPSPSSCMFNGMSISSGASVTAYLTATIPFGQTCLSETRTCARGILSGSYLFSSCVVGQTSTASGWLKVQGNKIINDQGLPVVLKGVNIADPEHLDTKPQERPNVTAKTVAKLATDTYFAQVIRLPILPGDPNFPDSGFFSATNGGEKYFKNHIEPLVNELTAKGIYVIIDLHYVSDYQNLYPKVQAFWTYMAPKFSNNPHVFYEIFNEPIMPDNWATWKNTVAQPAVDLIRSYAPNNLILIGGPYWSSHMLGAATNPVVGTNLVYIGHVYSNQTAAIWEPQFVPVLNKYPLFISEWGFEQGGTEGGTMTYGQQFESWMRLHDLSWTVWSFDILWGPRMFNRDWSLKDAPGGMGTFVRDLLLEQKQK